MWIFWGASKSTISFFTHRNQSINRKGTYILVDVLAMGNSTVGAATRSDIFRPQTHSVPQTIVFRYREIGGRLCTKHKKIVWFLPKEYYDRNKTFFHYFVHNLP
jgi:hypothetical protein